MPVKQFRVFDPNRGDVLFNAALMSQVLASGNQWFVNDATGSDSDGDGSSSRPFKSLAKALDSATANNGDTVYLQGTGRVSSTLVWNKSGVNLVGMNARSANSRSRISPTVGAAAFTPLVSVTGQGCVFANLATFHGFDDDSAQVCWIDSGGRNYYSAVQFLGMGHATAGAHAGGRSLVVSGGNGECVFEDCRIGLDTIPRDAANASLEFLGGSPRNEFNRCTFSALATDAGAVHVLAGQGGIDRYALFRNCLFLNAEFGGPSATAMTAAISADESAGGLVILDPGCVSVGAGKISAAGPVYVGAPVPTGGTSGLAVAAS